MASDENEGDGTSIPADVSKSVLSRGVDAFALSFDSHAVIELLMNFGVLHTEQTCVAMRAGAHCGAKMHLVRFSRCLDGFNWRCPVKECRATKTVRIDSYFRNHHNSLSEIFRLLYCYVKYDKIPQKYIADLAGVSENTMVDWGINIRKTISRYLTENPLVLGKRFPVQIDESLFGGKCKFHRGDHARHEQTWVFGIIEEKTNLCFMCAVDDRKKLTLLPLIQSHIHADSTVKSDEWPSYRTLDMQGFEHLTVNHSVGFVQEGVHTQLVESLWAQVKSIIKVKRGTRAEYLQGYLDYYCFIRLAEFLKIPPFEMFLRLIQVEKF